MTVKVDALLRSWHAAREPAELIQRQREEAGLSSAVLRAIREVAAALSEPDLLGRTANLAVDLFGSECCVPSLFDESLGGFRAAAGAGDITDAEWAWLRNGIFNAENFPLAAELSRRPDVLPIEDVYASGLYPADVLEQIRRRSVLAVPLVVAGALMGIVTVSWTTRVRRFQAEDLCLADALAGVLGLALERVRLLGARKAQAEWLAEAAKLGVISTMASGVAQDFKSLLGMILGRAELARLAIERGKGDHASTIEALRAIEKAAEDAAQAVQRTQRFAQLDQRSERAALADPRTGLRILVVDDEPAIGRILADALLALGHAPSVCSSGDEAARQFDPSTHDLVMTDQGMPGLTGTELATLVKQRSPATPVMLVTGWGSEMEGRSDAVDMVIPKPFRMSTIRRALDRIHAERRSAP